MKFLKKVIKGTKEFINDTKDAIDQADSNSIERKKAELAKLKAKNKASAEKKKLDQQLAIERKKRYGGF